MFWNAFFLNWKEREFCYFRYGDYRILCVKRIKLYFTLDSLNILLCSHFLSFFFYFEIFQPFSVSDLTLLRKSTPEFYVYPKEGNCVLKRTLLAQNEKKSHPTDFKFRLYTGARFSADFIFPSFVLHGYCRSPFCLVKSIKNLHFCPSNFFWNFLEKLITDSEFCNRKCKVLLQPFAALGDNIG